MECDAHLDASPWLYDVASDASGDGIDGEEVDALLDRQDEGTRAWAVLLTGPIDEVQCAGVTATGAQCTRTTRIPMVSEAAAGTGDLYCYRHQHQRRQRGDVHHAKTGGCTRLRCCCRNRAQKGSGMRRTRQLQFWRQFLAVVALFGCSLAAASVGVARHSVFLCAASAFSLFVSVDGACIVVCLTISRVLPPPANVDKVAELALATFNDSTREAEAPPTKVAESA